MEYHVVVESAVQWRCRHYYGGDTVFSSVTVILSYIVTVTLSSNVIGFSGFTSFSNATVSPQVDCLLSVTVSSSVSVCFKK